MQVNDDCRKCAELKGKNDKQQMIIDKLQHQIRQRCQSYLLQVSRFKKSSVGSANSNNFQQTPTKGPKQERSQTTAGMSSYYQQSNQRPKTQRDQMEISELRSEPDRKLKKLAIFQQIDIKQDIQTGKKQCSAKNCNNIFGQQVIDALKVRISELQNSKNQEVKVLKQTQKSLRASELKNAALMKEIQDLKLREKLAQRNVEELLKFQSAFKLIQKQLDDPKGKYSVSAFEESNNPIKKAEKFLKIFKNKQGTSIQKPNILQNSIVQPFLLVDSAILPKQQTNLKNFKEQQKKQAFQNSPSNKLSKTYMQLEPSYYVEQDLQNQKGNDFVKRSFIRKKVIRRNMSATTYRTFSKDKSQIADILKNKLSGDKNNIQTAGKSNISLREAILKEEEDNRVSQISRQSQVSDHAGEQIKVIEMQTRTPHQLIHTTKVYSKNGESNLNFIKKI